MGSNNNQTFTLDEENPFEKPTQFGDAPQINVVNMNNNSPRMIPLEHSNSTSPTINVTQNVPLDSVPASISPNFNDPTPNNIDINAQSATQPKESLKIWNVEYWAFLFNVTTRDVLVRFVMSFNPVKPKLYERLSTQPDMYGPFWIASTLIFLLAVVGNIVEYIQSDETDSDPDVGKLSAAASGIYGYISICPILLYLLLRFWLNSRVSLVLLWSVYGYSLSVYIPISILCVIPSDVWQWIIIMLAGILSTAVLVMNLFACFAAFSPLANRKILYLLIVIGLLHLSFAIGCKFVFFVY